MSPRRTKIVCTLGPATASEKQIEALIQAGMDVARINFSHGTQQEHRATIERVRAVAARLHQPVAILQDLQGPKIRTGALENGRSVTLRDGQTFTITTTPQIGTAERVSTTYEPLPRDVRSGDTILLSDGAMELRVASATGADVICTVIHGGTLAEHQGINLPGVAVSAPALTEKDRADLAFGVAQRVDYVALSFVRTPRDVRTAKDLIAKLLAQHPHTQQQRPEGLHPSAYAAEETIPVIAKLEKPEAIERLDAILAVADGVMVARGDLGVEMPLERVPVVQKLIIRQANARGLPVITATQMLESMVHSPRPTRAEASDVANAILDGTDAVMLSAETSIGAFPVEAVRVMASIAVETEESLPVRSQTAKPCASLAQAVAVSAQTLADKASAPLIAVFTRTGASARLISKERPRAFIVAYTPFETVYRRLSLWWGVTPRQSELLGSTEDLIAWVDGELQREQLASPGDEIVIMGGMPIAGRARTNFLKLHQVGES
ncbi:MAG TPA: pyruvate kinase [Ktedonobacterales bacterium]|nr:pyruvate kinase [Ktedonobacterales bacterium]